MSMKRQSWNSGLKQLGRTSLQLRLTTGITTIALLSIGTIGTWTTWEMRKMLVVSHQQEIEQIAGHLDRQLTMTDRTKWRTVIAEWATPSLWIGVKQPNGKLVQAGKPMNFSNQDFSSQASVMADQMADEIASKIATVPWRTLPPGPTVQQISGRQLVLDRHLLQQSGRPAGELYLARDITHDYQVLSTLVNQLLFGTVLALLPIAALMAMYIRQVLSPLRRVNQLAVAQVAQKSRGAIVPAISSEVPQEVAGLVQVMSSLSSRLTETGEKQRDFTNSLSHELRTSLCLVQGYLKSTLRRGENLTPVQREALEVATSEVDRTVDLLQDLLDLGRNLGQNGSTTYNLKPVMLNDLIESAVRSVDLEGDRQIELEAEMLITAQAEVKALHRVLVHLLKNAQQFSQPDQPIRIRLAQSGNLAIIQVIDQGCGIAAADQPHLFEPFYRVEQSRCRDTGGMGLGLAIVKSLVEAMNGEVSVISQPGAGSQFTVELQSAPVSSDQP